MSSEVTGAERHEQPELRVVGPHAYADWEAVYRDNVVRVYQLLFRRVGNAPDAEDLTEEVMVRTLRTLALPAPVREVRSYLVKTARSVLSEHWTRHYGEPPELEPLDGPVPEHLWTRQLAAAGGGEPARRARAILDALPERSRRVLELRFLRGLSVRDAAAEMGVTEGNLKVLQFRALRQAAARAQELES